MTTKQKQHFLAYLGYYTGAIDGIWGPRCQAATEAFQRDYSLTANGKFGTETEKRIREVIATGNPPHRPQGQAMPFSPRPKYRISSQNVPVMSSVRLGSSPVEC